MAEPRSDGCGDPERRFQLIGVGVGPSNLALAVAIRESSRRAQLAALFLERAAQFRWHAGMLLDDARVQISFLKDLVTLRDPCSRFSFLNYLKERGRLGQFVNLRTFTPTRCEFNDYYRWVAAQLREQIRYQVLVTDVTPRIGRESDDGDWIDVHFRDGKSGQDGVATTRNVVLGTGGVPVVPPGIDLKRFTRVCHASTFVDFLEQHFADRTRPWRFVVVGSGQSAAEVFQHLIRTYQAADVTAALRRFAFKPSDESLFVNEIFYSQAVDFFYELPAEKRERLIDAHRDTNYSVVDADLIRAIYEELYRQRLQGNERARLMPFVELRGISEEEGRLNLHFHDLMSEASRSLAADGVVLATGYERPRRHPLLGKLEPYLQLDEKGYRIQRDYRIAARRGFGAGVFLQGFSEDTHGLSDTLLSDLPFRSQRIVDSLLPDDASQRFLRDSASGVGSENSDPVRVPRRTSGQ